MTARGDDRGGGKGRKLGETVQVKNGGRQGGGAPAGDGDAAGERKGGGGERAGAAGCFPLVRAGCRETRGPMSAHQLSLAPSACPYMVRPLRGRSRSSPYKGRNLNTGYTLFSARGRGPRSMGAPPSGLQRGPGRGWEGARRPRGPPRCGRAKAARASCGALRCHPRLPGSPPLFRPAPRYCFRGDNANEPGSKSNCFCLKK